MSDSDHTSMEARDLEAMQLAGELIDPDEWEAGELDDDDVEEPLPSGGIVGPIIWWALSPGAQATVLAGLSVWVTRLVGIPP